MGWFTGKLQNCIMAMHKKQLLWDYQRLTQEQKAIFKIVIYSSINIVFTQVAYVLYRSLFAEPNDVRIKIIRLFEKAITDFQPINNKLNYFTLALRYWIISIDAISSKSSRDFIVQITKELNVGSLLNINNVYKFVIDSKQKNLALNLNNGELSEEMFLFLETNDTIQIILEELSWLD